VENKTQLVDWKSKTDLMNQVLDLQIEVNGAKELDILSRLISTYKIKNMVDVGCHNGGFTQLLAVRHPDVNFLGVDIDEIKIREAHEKNRLPNVRFEVCDVMNCPSTVFDSVDGIFERYTVQHLDAKSFLERILKFTKGKAKLFCVEAYHPLTLEWPKKGLFEEYMKQFHQFFLNHKSDFLLALNILGIAREVGYQKNQTHIALAGLWQCSQEKFIEVKVKTGYLIHEYCPDLFSKDFLIRFEEYLRNLDSDQQVYDPTAVIEIYN